MSQGRASFAVNPGKGLGFLLLGGSLYDVLQRLRAQANTYPSIDIAYSFSHALSAPVTVTLPKNGIRLRFDGPDQRLRLIEVLDFGKISLTYKGNELVRSDAGIFAPIAAHGSNGPAFRQVYHKLFGPTFPGEYFAPSKGSRTQDGTYVLSYPGVAFSFHLSQSAWSSNPDFVSVLSSPEAAPASCLSIFNGSSWKDARSDLFTRPCPHPRSLSLTGHGRDTSPDEVETAIVKGHGRVELQRRSTPSFHLVLGETTPQDLVAELGPPDAIYRKHDRRLSIHKHRAAGRPDQPPLLAGSPGHVGGLSDAERSSASARSDDSSPEEDAVAGAAGPATECFWNYFRYGFDVFVASGASVSRAPLDPAAAVDPEHDASPTVPLGVLVATKLLLHGNVPGAHAFQRYRRGRWALDAAALPPAAPRPLDSETPFAHIKAALRRAWSQAPLADASGSVYQRPMMLSRGWGNSAESSCELLGEWEDGSESPRRNRVENQVLDQAELHGFPGLLFEVLRNDAVDCLTVY